MTFSALHWIARSRPRLAPSCSAILLTANRQPLTASLLIIIHNDDRRVAELADAYAFVEHFQLY
jgi:hypothetical protein